MNSETEKLIIKRMNEIQDPRRYQIVSKSMPEFVYEADTGLFSECGSVFKNKEVAEAILKVLEGVLGEGTFELQEINIGGEEE